MNDLGQLREYLGNRLKSSLPGEISQKRMMAIPDSKFRFNDRARENARHSGVLILFYRTDEYVRIPMILRHSYGGVHSGQVSLPGGRVEPEDENIIATALRETEEEIGVPRNEIEVLGQLTELFIPVSNYLVFPMVGVTDINPDFVPEPREVDQILHPPLTDLMDDQKEKSTMIQVRDIRINAPYFDLEGQTVWGATAMMLSELKQILKEAR